MFSLFSLKRLKELKDKTLFIIGGFHERDCSCGGPRDAHASPEAKLQDLKQFAIHIDLTTLSDGLNAFEKIFSFVNQEEMNFLLGQRMRVRVIKGK